MRLLRRLYDPTSGAVLIDGADVRERRPGRCARDRVVDDDPFLFSATVHDNIAYARPDATREEVERAAERAQAAGFIAELPDGYDTRVGERGLTLSGGQRQRLAIARALLADPRILILDDATSSVDASTEQAIKEALREVMAGRTTFVIAHRLSTIALADEIVVLEDGRDRGARHARRAARERRCTRRSPRRACRTRCSSTASRIERGGGPVSAARGARGPASPTSRRDGRELRRRCARPAGAGASCAACSSCCAPTAAAHADDARLAAARHRRRAGAAAAGQARDRRRDRPGDLRALTWIVIAFLASALIYWGATYAQTYLVGWVGQRALQDLRIQLFAHLQTLSVGFYSRRQAGVLISRLTNDVQALDQLVSDGVVTLFGSTLTLIGTAAILIVLDLELALLTFLVFPVLALGSLAFRIVSADAYRLTREKVAAITAYLQESLSGIRVVRSFAQEERHLAALRRSSTTRTARRT